MSVPAPGQRGILFVLSAPSGTGKSSLCRRLLEQVDALDFSVSYTTRHRRPGEEHGRQYYFVDDARFDAMVAEDAFLEWADVFGERYGTGKEATRKTLESGRDLLLDIDVQGARQVRARGENAVSIFMLPPDYGTLESRLRARRSEDDAQVRGRLAVARGEAAEYRDYDYLVVNDELERAASDLVSIVRAERRRVTRCDPEAGRILESFPRS